MKTASGRSPVSAAKAALISLAVVALISWTCSPRAWAASVTPWTVISALVGLAGLTSTATRTAFGINPRRSASRFVVTSVVNQLKPVTLPPGRAKLVTRPSSTGSKPIAKTIGTVAVASFAARAARVAAGVAITATRRRTRAAISAGRLVLAVQPVVFDRRVLVVDSAGLAKALAECGCIPLCAIFRQPTDQPDHWHRPLLRAYCE